MSNETKKFAGLGTLQAFLDGCKTIFANITHKHTMSDITDSATVLEDYETKEDAQTKYDNAVAHSDANLETAKSYTDTVVSGKADKTYVESTFAKKSDVQDVDLSNYYNKTEIDNMELISTSDIDVICSATIQVATASAASEVTF